MQGDTRRLGLTPEACGEIAMGPGLLLDESVGTEALEGIGCLVFGETGHCRENIRTLEPHEIMGWVIDGRNDAAIVVIKEIDATVGGT